MRNHFRSEIIAVVFLLILGLLGLSGCPAPPAGNDNQPVEEDGSDANRPDNSLADLHKETNLIPDLPGGRTDAPITADEVAEIEGFGNFQYPGSVLVEEHSVRQNFLEGTEIYRLEFTASAGIKTVGDWYEANLEEGTESASETMPSGSVLRYFNYETEDRTLIKSVSAQGIPGENECRISVSMSRILNKGEAE